MRSAMEKALEASKQYAEQARAQEDLARNARRLEAEAYEKMQQESEKMRICHAQVPPGCPQQRLMWTNRSERTR